LPSNMLGIIRIITEKTADGGSLMLLMRLTPEIGILLELIRPN